MYMYILTNASTFAFFQYGGLSRALAFMSESAGSFCCISVVPRFPSLGEAEDNEVTLLDVRFGARKGPWIPFFGKHFFCSF